MSSQDKAINSYVTLKMIDILRSEQRGKAEHGWLKSYHSFSFADYYNPQRMGFRALRVINEDYVQPGKGFGTHPHANMEILTYVVQGQIAHKDSMGNVKAVSAGEVQAMSAGSGVRHSEFNPLDSELLHLLQIWILPDKNGVQPSYSEWRPKSAGAPGLQLFASPDGQEGSIKINQNCSVYLGHLVAGGQLRRSVAPTRALWLQLISGELSLSGETLSAGDAASLEQVAAMEVLAKNDAKFILFDLA